MSVTTDKKRFILFMKIISDGIGNQTTNTMMIAIKKGPDTF